MENGQFAAFHSQKKLPFHTTTFANRRAPRNPVTINGLACPSINAVHKLSNIPRDTLYSWIIAGQKRYNEKKAQMLAEAASQGLPLDDIVVPDDDPNQPTRCINDYIIIRTGVKLSLDGVDPSFSNLQFMPPDNSGVMKIRSGGMLFHLKPVVYAPAHQKYVLMLPKPGQEPKRYYYQQINQVGMKLASKYPPLCQSLLRHLFSFRPLWVNISMFL